MKKLLFVLACFLSFSALAQDNKVFNDANATARVIKGSFTGIRVSSGIDLYLTQSDKESVAVSAPDAEKLARLKTELVNGVLKIYYDHKGVTRTSGHGKLKAYVSFKTLSMLHIAAGSEVLVQGSIRSDKLELNVSSGSSFSSDVVVGDLTASVSSGAQTKVSGKAGTLKLNASSGADFKGYDFATEFCDVTATSGASVRLTINKELNAKAGSGADIRYKGAGLIRDLKVNGGGSVKKA